jgi:hypothetical protein
VTRDRFFFHAHLISFMLITALWLYSVEGLAFQMTPSSITESEGTAISLGITIEPGDWQEPDGTWVNQCAAEGVANAKWVAIMKFHYVDETATFGISDFDGDVHLEYSGANINDSTRWFKCESSSQAPSSNRSWSGFAVVINEDNLVEGPERAKLVLHKVQINSSSWIADSMFININGNFANSDWRVSVENVAPTSVYPDESISFDAIGKRSTNPDFSYNDGWSVSFLLSTDSDISLSDTVLETRRFGDFASEFNETWTGVLNVQPGTYWVGACSTISDDDPSNDCSLGEEITVLGDLEGPDLDVIALSADPASVESGGRIEILTDIENAGIAAAGASTLRLYLAKNNQVSEDDIQIATSAMPALAAGESWRFSQSVVIGVSPGDYYLLACVDPVTDESSIQNNCAFGPVITVSARPVDECGVQPLSCDSVISGTLNSDDCATGPRGANHYAEKFTIDGLAGDRLFLNGYWFGTLDGYLYIEGPTGLTVAHNDNHTGKSNSRIEYELKQDGQFTVWATSYNSGERGSFDLSLGCDSPPGPDLVPDALAVDEAALLPGQKMVVSTRLRNMGDADSDAAWLRYMLSSDPVIDFSDTELASNRSNRLTAGSSRAVDRELLAPATPGAWYLGVCADVVAGEASLSNNCSAGTLINVNPRQACTRRSLSCGEYVTGYLSSADCSNGPRGNGFLTEVLEINVTNGREFVISAEWNDIDGYLLLNDPSSAVVAEDDDSGPGSRIEYKAAQAGVHELWVTSFDRNETGSFGVDLRCGTTVAPDLNASPVSVDVNEVISGYAVGLSGTVHNAGNASSPETKVRVMQSFDPTISASDEIIATVDVPALAAGASSLVELSVGAPAKPGHYWLGLCAVPVEGETLTGNNCSVTSLAQAGSGTESSGNLSKPQQAANDNGTLLMVSTGNSCSSATLSCSGTVGGSLAVADCDSGPRGTGFLTDPITFSGNQGTTISLSSLWTGFDGYLYLQDPTGEIVAENDDSGNSSSQLEVVLENTGTYTVWPTGFNQGTGGQYQLSLDCDNPQAPDLEVDKPELSVTSLRPGQSLNIRTEARNAGGLTSDATTLDFVLASDAQLAGGKRVIRTNDVPALAGGTSSTEAADVAIYAPPGLYYVGACVNLDGRETDTDNNCQVAGPVTIEATSEPIAINSGLNDAWYDPSTSGQGFFINVFPDNSQVFLSWFTFDTTRPPGDVPYQLGDPGHRWLTAQGVYDLGVAELNLFLTEGGVFDAGEPVATTGATPYGTMTLSFSDCNSGLIEFNLPSVNESGSIAISRVSSENVAACEDALGALTSSSATAKANETSGVEADGPAGHIETHGNSGNRFNYNSSLNDAWFNPATNGQGFFFNVFPDSNFVFLSWFTYDLSRPADDTPFDLGEPGHRWLTAQGPFDGDSANLKVYQTSGGVFNTGSLSAANTIEVGSITASFEDCNSGLISYDIDSVGRANDVPVQRLAPDSVPACEAKSSVSGGVGAGGGAGTSGGPVGAALGVTPRTKSTLANRCNGSVDWVFDWPDVEGAALYQFELYRNDSLAEAPRIRSTVSGSKFSYSGKENLIDEAHIENWHWRYRPVIGLGENSGGAWSEDFFFDVKSPDDPCLD